MVRLCGDLQGFIISRSVSDGRKKESKVFQWRNSRRSYGDQGQRRSHLGFKKEIVSDANKSFCEGLKRVFGKEALEEISKPVGTTVGQEAMEEKESSETQVQLEEMLMETRDEAIGEEVMKEELAIDRSTREDTNPRDSQGEEWRNDLSDLEEDSNEMEMMEMEDGEVNNLAEVDKGVKKQSARKQLFQKAGLGGGETPRKGWCKHWFPQGKEHMEKGRVRKEEGMKGKGLPRVVDRA